MIPVETAIRAWVQPKRKRRKRPGPVPWRPAGYGERLLFFDTETTRDFTQRLLFGVFRICEQDRLLIEGIVEYDGLSEAQRGVIRSYALRLHLPVYTLEEFIERVFYPEVYVRGTLCVGFNLPFDLSRIAIHAGSGRAQNSRSFRFKLSRRTRWPDLRIEAVSSRAAFIRFVPKKHLAQWGEAVLSRPLR